MLYGNEIGGHATIDPYAYSVADINFVSGVYKIDGAIVALADIIDQPSLVSGSGLLVQTATAGGQVKILGPLLAKLVSGLWTVMVEWHLAESTGRFPDVLVLENFIDGTSKDYIEFYLYSGTNFSFDDQTFDSALASHFREAFVVGEIIPAGRNRMAATRSLSAMALSVNGSAVNTVTIPAQATVFDHATFGGFDNNAYLDGHIRSLKLYAGALDLPTLSAL